MTVASFGSAGPAAVALMAITIGAISASDDLLFATLDAASGYKTLDEALFDYGKAFAIGTATSAISYGFGGVADGVKGLTNIATTAVSNSHTIAQIAVKTAMTGLQTATTSLATTTLNSITYSSKNGFGWSNEAFNSGINGMGTGILTSMASSFTTNSLTAFNSGFDDSKLAGFNRQNIKDVGSFNNLAGGLAGQGVNYALGGNFNLNVLNLNQFSNYNSGLLELSFGRDGVSMQLGTGGADTSFGTLASAMNGFKVLNVNSQINSYVNDGNNEFKSAIALRSQYGYGGSHLYFYK